VNIAVISVLYQKKGESAIDLEAIDSFDDSDKHKEIDDDNANWSACQENTKSGENVSYVTNKKRRYSSKVHPRRI
jgi:GT2 family glycosyltransferase